MVEAYWNVGREIVEKQGGSGRATYGDGLIDRIAAKLTAEFGPGYTRSNLRTMRQFYLMFPICHAVSDKLTWTHYRTLITVENEAARQYYFEEAIKSKWSVRDLQRQISTQFYQRLIANHSDLSTAGKLVKRGKRDARDIVRSPAILEFAGISPAEYKEKDLQAGLVKHLSKFMLELGRGFALVREQCPIQIGNETYHCDLLFYNFIARCFVLIDLKVGKVTPQDIGQMQLYKHYYEREMMNPGDNPPIGIVLGSDRDEAVIRYTLNEHERNLFAVKYHLNLPTVEELQMELMRERAAIEEAMALRALPPPEPKKKSVSRRTPKGDK
ncbi:YhcG family protein [Fibrobacter sp.]|uniref:PDDEXK nuclease domain-containing protein n=1 Tax=Fibrobacter sp. TaxID=35828 RepID=UPI0038903422